MLINIGVKVQQGKMYKIEIKKRREGLKDTFVVMALEKLLKENSELRFTFKSTGSLTDLRVGLFGLDTYIFEVEKEGVIVYEKFCELGGLHANVCLLGFNEGSVKYQNLQSKLDRIKSGKVDLKNYLEKGEFTETS